MANLARDIVGDDDWMKTELEQLQSEVDEKGVSDVKEFLRGKLKDWRNVEVNIAVTGDSGAGKSSFINAIRELRDDDEGAAPVGVTQCTKEPTAYSHPTSPYIRFWDLPGIGTPNYPDLDTYVQQVDLEKYHAFLIFTATRFTVNDLQLAEKIRSMQKKFFFVRTKVDQDVQAESRKRSFDENAMLAEMRDECLKSLDDLVSKEEDVFLISSHLLDKWDFARLTQAILDSLERNQRDSLTLSFGKLIIKSSTAIFQRKVNALKRRILLVAGASGSIAAIPIPGLSTAVDAAIILLELRFYRSQLGLPKIGSIEFLKLDNTAREKVALLMSIRSAAQLSAVLASYAVETAIEEAVALIPIVGSVVASVMSFATTCIALRALLSHVEEAALLVLKKSLEETAAELEID